MWHKTIFASAPNKRLPVQCLFSMGFFPIFFSHTLHGPSAENQVQTFLEHINLSSCPMVFQRTKFQWYSAYDEDDTKGIKGLLLPYWSIVSATDYRPAVLQLRLREDASEDNLLWQLRLMAKPFPLDDQMEIIQKRSSYYYFPIGQSPLKQTAQV